MKLDKRKTYLSKPIQWTGDLLNNCAAEWAGLLLQAELLDEDRWWWAVYDTERNNAIVDTASEYDQTFKSGEATREKAEWIAKQYLENTTRPVTARYLINDVFNITGRGLVFTGNITEGEIVSAGDTLEFKALGKIMHRTIIGVERAISKPGYKISIGLLIRCRSEMEIKELRNSDFQNVPAIVYSRP